MNRALPRVAEKLLRFHVHPSMYATQWFMTLFTYTLPFDAAVRVWDAFLCEGWKAVFRASLALLRALEPRLVAAKDFEQVWFGGAGCYWSLLESPLPSPPFPKTVLAFKRLGEPGFVHPDALGLVSGPTRLRQKELKALEVEHALLGEHAGLCVSITLSEPPRAAASAPEAAGLPTADAKAGTWPRDAAAAARVMRAAGAATTT